MADSRRGMWKATILVNTPTMIKTGSPHCSECGKTAPQRTAFCPNCGVAMLFAAEEPKQTHFDQIKSFTLEEMAEFLLEHTVCKTCVYSRYENCKDVPSCKDGIKKWLESEVKTDDINR